MPALCGMDLEHPVMNAAGTCKTLEDVSELARSAVAAIVVGSITVHGRTGNSGTTYHSGSGFSLNALGLPNRGLAYYREHLPAMAQLAHRAGKPLIVSIAGFSTQEYAEAVAALAHSSVDAFEINLACPNVWDGGSQKRIACFDLGQTAAVCAAVNEALSAAAAAMPGQAGTDAAAAAPGAAGPGATRRVPYGVKISPFSDPEALAGLADVLAKQGGAPGGGGPRYVVAVNTFPNALAYDTDGRRPAIDVELAGMAGPALRPIALGQVRQLRRLLPAEIDIVGAGGITTGRDVADFLRSGASAVQLATAYFNRDADPAVFGEIAADWAEHWLDA